MRSHQASLFGSGEPAVNRRAAADRVPLDDASWIELSRRWMEGADTLLAVLIERVAWQQGRRRMYDRIVDDPRLSRWYPSGAALPHEALGSARDELARRYGVSFGAVGLNHYRDGSDSVAFHRDRELRHLEDTLVAILSLGAERPFLLRPLGGGCSVRLRLAPGDLLVMGGACQARWEHSVPKVAASDPRVSVSLRWSSGLGPPAARTGPPAPDA